MRLLVLSTILTMGSFVAAAQPSDVAGKDVEVIPQARPVLTWLKSVKDGDQKQLKTVFSERVRKQLDAGGWDKVLTTYRTVFKKEFGDYKLEDFAFEFTGDEEKGKVSVVHKGKKLPGLRVIKEKREWKVNEQ